jgi:hypothetical protein
LHAVADALMQRHTEILQAEDNAIHAEARQVTPVQLADTLIDLLVKLHPKMLAFTALMDSRTDWTEIRCRFRSQVLAGIKTALTTRAANLEDKEAEDIAAVVLNNMKTMVGMIAKDAPTSPGAPDQLRLMNRLYLSAKLAPGRPERQQWPDG